MKSSLLHGNHLNLVMTLSVMTLSFLAVGADAEEVTYTNSTTVLRTDLDWAAQEQEGVFASISLPEFDPALGTLKSVEFDFLGSLDASGMYQFAFTGGPTTNAAVDIGMIYGVVAGGLTVREQDFLVTSFPGFGFSSPVPCCEQIPIDFPSTTSPEFPGSDNVIIQATDSDFESYDFSDIKIIPQQYIQNLTPGFFSTADEMYEISFTASVTYKFIPVPEPSAMLALASGLASILLGRRRHTL